MADFLSSYKTVRANEGGYRNVSWDAGGETYKGIARNYWPAWSGWAIIDDWKKNHTLKTGDYIPNAALDQYVKDFFKLNFWDKNKLGGIANQSLATLCLDMVIQHGKGPRLINEEAAKIRPVPTSSTVTADTIAVLNQYPERCYKAISARRVAYVESLKDNLGPDYAAVLNRAKSFLTKYSAQVAAGAGLLVAALFFF